MFEPHSKLRHFQLITLHYHHLKEPTSVTIIYNLCYLGHCRNVPLIYSAIPHMDYNSISGLVLVKNNGPLETVKLLTDLFDMINMQDM